MSDASLIIEKIRKEIESYSDSNQKTKKLIFENTTTALLSKLEKFLDSALSEVNLSEIEQEDFRNQLYKKLGWKLYDN